MEAEKPLTLEQVMDRLPMSDTATALSKRIDMRRRRAYVLASSIMQELQHLIPDANHREAYDRLRDLLTAKGVEVLTDHDREQLGLAPRGPDGWTVEEILALEQLRVIALTRPISMTVPAKAPRS